MAGTKKLVPVIFILVGFDSQLLIVEFLKRETEL